MSGSQNQAVANVSCSAANTHLADGGDEWAQSFWEIFAVLAHGSEVVVADDFFLVVSRFLV